MRKFIAALLVLSAAVESKLNYEIYLESWDSQYQSAYQGLPNGYSNVTLNIGFAAFAFTTMYNASGLNGTQFNDAMLTGQDSAVSAVVSFVHSNGGNVQMAYGGNSYAYPWAPNYFISQTAGWPGNSQSLANGVANVINTLGLDGVDFDIEDPQPGAYTAQQFAQQLTTFLQQVRALLPSKTITLTIPGQGWGQYWQYLAQNVAAIPGLVNAINFMEYDLWINTDAGLNYEQQVEADIVTYTAPLNQAPEPNSAQGWALSPSLIQLGIMPGNDDLQHNMTLAYAQQLTQFAINTGLEGVFVWDVDRDSQLVTTPTPFITYPPYQYSNAIRSVLDANQVVGASHLLYELPRRHVNYGSMFIKQINPRQGLAPFAN